MSEPLSTALEQAQARAEAPTVYDLLDRMRPEIEKALPATLREENRFARLVTTELRRNPALLECSAHSIIGCTMLAAQLGLEPGPLGHVYFIPYGGEATFVVGYKGYAQLAYRGGVKRLTAELVFEGEPFKEYGGSAPKLVHEIDHALRADPNADAAIVQAYAAAKLPSNEPVWQVITERDWERSRKASPLGRKGQGLWAENFREAVYKTAIRRLADKGSLPLSPDFMRAANADETEPPLLVDVPAELPEATA